MILYEMRAEKKGDVSHQYSFPKVRSRAENNKLQKRMRRGQASSFHLRQFLEGPREGAMRTALSFSQWVPFLSGVLQRLQAGTLERRKGLVYHLVRF